MLCLWSYSTKLSTQLRSSPISAQISLAITMCTRLQHSLVKFLNIETCYSRCTYHMKCNIFGPIGHLWPAKTIIESIYLSLIYLRIHVYVFLCTSMSTMTLAITCSHMPFVFYDQSDMCYHASFCFLSLLCCPILQRRAQSTHIFASSGHIQFHMHGPFTIQWIYDICRQNQNLLPQL